MNQDVALDHLLLAEDGPSEPILPAAGSRRSRAVVLQRLDWRQGAGVALMAVGLVAVIAGWLGVSGTGNTGDQLSYIASGGVGGAVLIALGVVCMVMREHVQDRAALSDLATRLALLESTVTDEFLQMHRQFNGTARMRAGSQE